MSDPTMWPHACPACGAQIAPGLLACPGCGQLVHSQRLSELADAARAATEVGDLPGALTAWREALDLLPRGSRQHQIISQKIIELGQQLRQSGGALPEPTSAQPANRGGGGKAAAGAGAIGLLLLKFKTLLFGLGKLSTLASMALSFGLYWSIWGWKFALGLVLSIYVHEMGHVIALRRYGFKATAPMFIPGLGAVIRLQQQIVDPREDAAIGLAGPIYGMGAALVTAAAWYLIKPTQPILGVIAGVNAWINLFNLLPIWTLDGGRAFHALSRPQRLITTAVCVGVYALSYRDGRPDGMVMLLAIVGGIRALTDREVDRKGDALATVQYSVMVVVLSMLATIQYIAHPTR